MCKLRAKAKMRCNANLLNVMLCYELQISELFVKNILDCRIYHAIDDISREWISFCCCCCCRSWRENKCVFHTLERDRMILAIKWAIKWYNMSWTPFFNSEQQNEREKKNRVMYRLVIALKLAKLTPCYNSAKAFELAFGVRYLVCAYFSFVNDLKQSKVNGKLILTAIEKYVFGFDLNSISSTLYNYFFWFGQ